MIHNPAAFRGVDHDGVIHFPPAAERARLRAQSAVSPDPGTNSAGAPLPAAENVMSDNTRPAAGAFSGNPLPDLPVPALDRLKQPSDRPQETPACDPPEREAGEGETALDLVRAKRREHVALGYDAAHDAQLPPTHLVDQAAKYLADAHDLIRRGADPAAIRLKLVNATALGLAALDRQLAQGEPTDAL